MPTNNAIAAAAAPVASSKPSWYAVSRKEQDEAEISIFDEIGAWGIRAEDFVADLKKITARRINLRLNTPGGEVFDATAIYNALCEHPAEIVVHIDGVAASAGSYIAMSGNEVRMADNAYLMIHNARGGIMGEAEEMRTYAGMLEKMNDNIAGIYERKAGKDRDHWHNLMDAETWFTAKEAKAEGLVDIVYAAADAKMAWSAKAKFDTSIYNKIPDPVKKMWGIPQTNNAPEVSRESEPAVPNEELHMATEASTQAAPAQTSAAVATSNDPQSNPPNPVTPPTQPAARTELESLRNATQQARDEASENRGFKAASDAATKRLQAIVAACPGHPQMAIDAFLSGQTPDAVKLAFEAAERVRVEAAARDEQYNMELTRLRAQLAVGGHPDGVDFGYSDTDPEAPPADPKAFAENEWDQKPSVRKGFSGKANYVAYRVRQLQGTIHRQAAASA